MNKFCLALALIFTMGLVTSCISDPRKNCNHPKHWEYVKERQMKSYRRNGLR